MNRLYFILLFSLLSHVTSGANDSLRWHLNFSYSIGKTISHHLNEDFGGDPMQVGAYIKVFPVYSIAASFSREKRIAFPFGLTFSNAGYRVFHFFSNVKVSGNSIYYDYYDKYSILSLNQGIRFRLQTRLFTLYLMENASISLFRKISHREFLPTPYENYESNWNQTGFVMNRFGLKTGAMFLFNIGSKIKLGIMGSIDKYFAPGERTLAGTELIFGVAASYVFPK